MSNQDIGNTDNTDESTTNNQAAVKTYTQEEFDQHMARMKASISKKYEKLKRYWSNPCARTERK